MAETGTNVQEATSQTEQQTPSANGNELPPELVKQMEISLNGKLPQENPAPTPAVQTPTNGEVKTETPITPATVVTKTEAPVFNFDIFKDKYGYNTPEDAIKEIEELRGFKSAPVTTADIEFENELSEKLFKAIQGGKTKEVSQILYEQERLNSVLEKEVSKDTAADIIKTGMQVKYKNLTPQQIDYRFNKQFYIPKAPVQSPDELDEDFTARKQDWQQKVSDVEMDMIIEANLIKPELENAKSKIVLPELEQTVDEKYLQWQKSLEDQPKLDAEIISAYKAFNSKSIETKIPFNDETNKVKFDFQYEPDTESFNKAVDVASDITKLVAAFTTSDGKPDRQGFLSAMYFALNKDKVLKEAMNQTKNATIKSFLLANGGGTQRQFPQNQEMSELDKQMQLSLNGMTAAR